MMTQKLIHVRQVKTLRWKIKGKLNRLHTGLR